MVNVSAMVSHRQHLNDLRMSGNSPIIGNCPATISSWSRTDTCLSLVNSLFIRLSSTSILGRNLYLRMLAQEKRGPKTYLVTSCKEGVFQNHRADNLSAGRMGMG